MRFRILRRDDRLEGSHSSGAPTAKFALRAHALGDPEARDDTPPPSSSPSGSDRYPRQDAFDRLSQCSLSASFRLAGNTRHRLLTNRLRCYASLSTGLVSRGNLRLFTLNKLAHHSGGTGLESLRIEKTTLFMKDFLTNAQPRISSVAPSPLVGQSHSDCEKAGSTSPR